MNKRNKWKFKDEREDVISFPPHLTHEQRREYIRERIALYDKLKRENMKDIINRFNEAFNNGTIQQLNTQPR